MILLRKVKWFFQTTQFPGFPGKKKPKPDVIVSIRRRIINTKNPGPTL